MYTDMSFDTHKHVKEFVKAGMPELQAEAIVELIHKSRDYDLSKLATKEQIILLDHKIESLSNEYEQKIAHIEEKMATKEDLFKLENQFTTIFKSLETQMARFETQIAKQDSQQKSWMMGIFLSIAAMAVTLILKIH